MIGKKYFLFLALILFGSPQKSFAIEPTEEEIKQILQNLKLEQLWFSVSAKSVLYSFCQRTGAPRLIDISSDQNPNLQKYNLIALLKFLNETGYWSCRANCQESNAVLANIILYENQLILLKAFYQTVGLAILDNLHNKAISTLFFKFITENFEQLPLPEGEKQINAIIRFFLIKKIELLRIIIKKLIPDKEEAKATIEKFYETIVKVGIDSEDELSLSARLAKAHIKLSSPYKTPQPKQGTKRRRKSKETS